MVPENEHEKARICLTRADLRGAHLEGAIISGAYLNGAILSEAHLEKTNLRGAHLDRAELRDAYLEGAGLPLLWCRMSLSGVFSFSQSAPEADGDVQTPLLMSFLHQSSGRPKHFDNPHALVQTNSTLVQTKVESDNWVV